jgi:hypothetical protein
MSSQAYIIKATGIHAKSSNKTPNILLIKISRIECLQSEIFHPLPNARRETGQVRGVKDYLLFGNQIGKSGKNVEEKEYMWNGCTRTNVTRENAIMPLRFTT